MKNMQVLIKLVLGSIILLSTGGCDNDEKDEKPPVKIDGEALVQNFKARVDERTQQFTIDATNGATVIGEEGTIVTFYSNEFLNEDNTPVTGEVTLELVEIFKKSDMLLSRKPTNGRNHDGQISTLISGGEFFINATQNGNQLKLKNGFYFSVPVDNTGGAVEGMLLFDGVEECEGDDCRLEWVETQTRMEVAEEEIDNGIRTAYRAFQSKFGWTNIDKWYSDPRPKTTLFVDVPEGYDNTNCAVFISYDGEPAALASLDIYHEETGLFTEHYGLIPIGLEVHFIFISIVDDKWNYAIQSATITENHLEKISNVRPITEAALEELVNALP